MIVLFIPRKEGQGLPPTFLLRAGGAQNCAYGGGCSFMVGSFLLFLIPNLHLCSAFYNYVLLKTLYVISYI